MAIHNLSDVPEPQDFRPIPAGTYPIRVIAADVRWSQRGAKLWEYEMLITEGEYAGRKVKDTVSFDMTHEKTYPRLKHVLDRFGVDWRSVDDDYPEILITREAYAPIVQKKVVGDDGVERIYNNAGFHGFGLREVPLMPYVMHPRTRASSGVPANAPPATNPLDASTTPF